MQGERQRQSVDAREFRFLEGRLDLGLKVLGSHGRVSVLAARNHTRSMWLFS